MMSFFCNMVRVETKVPGAYFSRADHMSRFLLWSPFAKFVDLYLPQTNRYIALKDIGLGYYYLESDDIPCHSLYYYRIDEKKELIPDPASRFQPDGVHTPSQLMCLDFDWHDQHWKGIPLSDYVIYELHVGTFSKKGTFLGVISHLDRLKELGITAIEFMPISQFSGAYNWGYDGVFPYSVHSTYGTPTDLQLLVDACHIRNIAVILDVVYNHAGPDGNVLWGIAPYFSDTYNTPWGDSVNFDGAYSSEVRNYFLQNALYWVQNFHFDALRLDAVHAIYDFSPKHFLLDLSISIEEKQKELGRKIHIFCENDRNDKKMVTHQDSGGYQLDAMWNDDFHHTLYSFFSLGCQGYYKDFQSLDDMLKVYTRGFVYDGNYSYFRKKFHGSTLDQVRNENMVVFIQNHDQVGNHPYGLRLSSFVSFAKMKMFATFLLLSNFIPLIFMGEEYYEKNPFLYFTDYKREDLIQSIVEGRKREFSDFFANCDDMLNPNSEKSFLLSKLSHDHQTIENRVLFSLYKTLIALRKKHNIFSVSNKKTIKVQFLKGQDVFFVHYSLDKDESCIFFNFSSNYTDIRYDMLKNGYTLLLNSSAEQWLGQQKFDACYSNTDDHVKLQPHGCVVFLKEQ